MFIRQITREIINEMVLDIIQNTKKNLKRYKILSIRDVYKSKNFMVAFSSKMSNFDNSIKSFLKEKMYLSKDVLEKPNNGKKVVKTLFFKIRNKPNKYLSSNDINENNIERSICDFIAGMTDRYAINLYNSIK